VKKLIMAVMAHADDLEVYAGGTMAKFVEQGYEGVLVMLSANIAGASAGGKKYRQTLPEECIPLRAAETRAAAEVLGVRRVEFLNFQDMLYSDGTDFVHLGDAGFNPALPGVGPLLPAVAMNPKLVAPVTEVIARYEPEIVIMQHAFSGFEHVTSGHIVNLAFRQAMKTGASLGQLWLPMTVRHCTWESDLRVYPSPNVLIDITAQWEKKSAAMLAHKSQRLEGAIEKIRLANRYWGMARQCELAEAFFTLCDARYR
jgi:LmbE family N-acetylglucosaminyl deacetylase